MTINNFINGIKDEPIISVIALCLLTTVKLIQYGALITVISSVPKIYSIPIVTGIAVLKSI